MSERVYVLLIDGVIAGVMTNAYAAYHTAQVNGGTIVETFMSSGMLGPMINLDGTLTGGPCQEV